MAEKSWFFNAEQIGEDEYDRTYLAEDFAKYFSMFIANGVFPNPSTGLQVVAADTPDMTVTLKPGYAFINGYAYQNTSDYSFSIDVADGVLDRIDCIFVRYYLADRAIKAYKEVGNASSAPSPGELIRTEDYWDLCVAQIMVGHGVTSITQSAITDTRMDTDLCGIVHAAVDQIDTKTLYLQIQTDLAEFKGVSQTEFDEWFESIKDKLSGDVAASLQLQIEEINSRLSGSYKATFLLDDWQEANGKYSQTVAVQARDGGPAITSTSLMTSAIFIRDDYPEETQAVLDVAAALIDGGVKTFGEGTITCSGLKEKPTSDIEVVFSASKGGGQGGA